MLKNSENLWSRQKFPIEDYRALVSPNGEPELLAIYQRIQRDFEAGNSGEYLARSIEQILETRRLDGCQEWGVLWTRILQELGINSTYIQGVDAEWLEQYAYDWNGDGWKGHVFLRFDSPEGPVVFCSTTARRVPYGEFTEGERIVDKRFVILFEGSGPDDFDACTQDGINQLLRPLVSRWMGEKER